MSSSLLGDDRGRTGHTVIIPTRGSNIKSENMLKQLEIFIQSQETPAETKR